MDAKQEAAKAFTRYERWMREEALPFWTSAGVACDGGVVERMTLDGIPDLCGFKRVRVHGRQLYVFSHAHCLGIPNMLSAASAAFDFLIAHGRNEDGGWVVKMGMKGGVIDDERDLYDQAFVILAMAWYHKASGNKEALQIARQTLEMIRRDYARKDGRGFLSRLPDRDEALQNPHMHLFEAVLALHAIAPDPNSEEVCVHLRDLFDEVLFDTDTGTLGEVFAMDWQLASGEPGRMVEPGHHYEWAWLLEMAQRQGFGEAEPAAGRLMAFAEEHGLKPDGQGGILIYDGVDQLGAVLRPEHRSWPQTERLKALAIYGERFGDPDYTGIAGALNALWTHYLAPAPHGCWFDHVDADMHPMVKFVPASTLYHLFLAYAELARTAPRLFGNPS